MIITLHNEDLEKFSPAGQQLSKTTALIESGVIRPIVDKVFPFEQTNDALAYIETGRAKGKVVITVTD
jgi:NADPH:quinone reductase-like Zn-dependent oxidoreductase